MAREKLREASDLLREASELADAADTQKRLYEQSDQLARLATREQEPDHGRLAKHMNALYELTNELDGDASRLTEEARESVAEFRETVEGV
jgi:hypothetical protein